MAQPSAPTKFTGRFKVVAGKPVPPGAKVRQECKPPAVCHAVARKE